MKTGSGNPRRWTLSIQVILAFTGLMCLSLSMFRLATSQSDSFIGAALFGFVGTILVGLAVGMVGGQLWAGTRVAQFRGAVLGGLVVAVPICGLTILPLLLYAFMIWRIETKRSNSASDRPPAS